MEIDLQILIQTIKKMKKTSVMRLVFTLIVCFALVGAVMAAFILKGQLHLVYLGFGYLGVYGVILLSFLIIQQIFSLLNNNWWIPKLRNCSKSLPAVGLQVVGYRQDPVLFRGCLMSLSKQDYPNIVRMIVGIDGNEQKDLLMEETFIQIFPEGTAIKLDKMFQDMTQSEKAEVRKIIGNAKYVCVSQPHSGKREIMYTAMNLHTPQTEHICFTDSDTFFETNTISELAKVMDGYDEMKKEKPKMRNLGAVTGNVEIWNLENMISYSSALRYWFAFNVERAADSFFGVVNCISGPLGLYRREIIDQIKDEWLHQTFLGQKCTFGDDRHLTNLLLIKGYGTHYTPLASCKTDTPAQLLRWIAQQTRWCKSFYRQFLVNLRSFHKQPLWLACQLVFQTVFPFFILSTLIWFVTMSLDIYCIIVTMIILMGFIRGLIGVIRTRKLVFFYYTFYVIFYVLYLVPCKLFAFLTLWNNQWGTSSRLGRASSIIKALHALIWAAWFILFYIAIGLKHVLVDKQSVRDINTLYTFYGCIAFMFLLFFHWQFYSQFYLFPKCQKEFEANKAQTEIDIKNRKAMIHGMGLKVSYATINTSASQSRKGDPPTQSLRDLVTQNI